MKKVYYEAGVYYTFDEKRAKKLKYHKMTYYCHFFVKGFTQVVSVFVKDEKKFKDLVMAWNGRDLKWKYWV